MQKNLLSPLLLVLIIVLILMTILGIFYLYFTAKNRERLALIEKGMNPNLSRSDFWPQVTIIGGGISAGLIIADLLSLSKFGPLLSIIFPSAGLLIYHLMGRTKMRRDSEI